MKFAESIAAACGRRQTTRPYRASCVVGFPEPYRPRCHVSTCYHGERGFELSEIAVCCSIVESNGCQLFAMAASSVSWLVGISCEPCF